MKYPVYLDYAATTPVDPQVAAAMCDCLTRDGIFGNPASRAHLYGWQAEEAVENARAEVAELLNADVREIVWTSGATEANNLAIKGLALANINKGRHIVTSSIEHKSVLDCCQYLASQGWEVSYVAPQNDGRTSPADIAKLIRPDTVLVSIMHVNNEIGVVNPLQQIAEICRESGVYFHVDAAQSAGKLAIDTQQLGVDLLSLSAHKIYGPKGVGALFVRRDASLNITAQIHGGGHERGMRSGTLATHQIVGLGKAAQLAKQQYRAENQRILALRQRFIDGISDLKGWQVNGCLEQRVAGNINIAFHDVDGEALITSLRDLAVSTGSACLSLTIEPSYVLRALGLPEDLALSSLRISVGRYTTEQDIDFAVEKVKQAVNTLRHSTSRYHRANNA